MSPFTDEDLKRLKDVLNLRESPLCIPASRFRDIIARLEAAETCASDLESICEIECPNCEKEFDDKHTLECETGHNLKDWRKAAGK